jgi:hypothetical protein
MNRHAIVIFAGLILSADAVRAAAQDVLTINVEGNVIQASGGERLGAGGEVKANDIGKPMTWSLSKVPDQCGFSVAPFKIDEKSTHAWSVEITPVRVAGDAATFRARWIRSRDNGKPVSQPKGDWEITLRAGESIPLDMTPFDGAFPGGPEGFCVIKMLSVRVSVGWDPPPAQDPRVVSVDLWLIERLPDGKDRTQALALRGQYHRAIPFFFDSIKEGTATLDLFGDLQISPGTTTSEVRITGQVRLSDKGPTRFSGKQTTATVRLLPNEVVSIVLPTVADNRTPASALSNRTLSMRIRVQQIR